MKEFEPKDRLLLRHIVKIEALAFGDRWIPCWLADHGIGCITGPISTKTKLRVTCKSIADSIKAVKKITAKGFHDIETAIQEP